MLFFFTFLLFYLFIVVIFLFKLLIVTMTRVLNFFLNHLFTWIKKTWPAHDGESLATNLAKCNKWRKYGILLVGIS